MTRQFAVSLSGAMSGFVLDAGFWRIELLSRPGDWAEGWLAWGRADHQTRIAADHVVTAAVARRMPVRLRPGRGTDVRLSCIQLAGPGEILAALGDGLAGSPRRALGALRAGLAAGGVLAPRRRTDIQPAWSPAFAHIRKPTDLEQGVFWGQPVSPPAISRIAEALDQADIVTWDAQPADASPRDVLALPRRTGVLREYCDMVGPVFAARSGVMGPKVLEMGIEGARDALLNDAGLRHIHLYETLSHRPAPTKGLTVQHAARDGVVDLSVVIPTRDRPELLRACLAAVRASRPAPRELVIVDHMTTDPDAARMIAEAKAAGAVVVRNDAPFNFSALVNLGVRASSSGVICLLNNDVGDPSPGWLDALYKWAMDVGVVGPELVYPSGDIQHVGLAMVEGEGLRHPCAGQKAGDRGPFNLLDYPREVLAVTGACLAMRREVFEQLGGFDETYPSDYNDVDLCLRAHEAGLKVVVTPHARAVHHESATRGRNPPQDPALWDTLVRRHPMLAGLDPFHSPRWERLPPGLRLMIPRP